MRSVNLYFRLVLLARRGEMEQGVEADQYRVLAAGDIEVCMGVVDPATPFVVWCIYDGC